MNIGRYDRHEAVAIHLAEVQRIRTEQEARMSEALGRIPRKIARTVFCDIHKRYYQEGSSCFDCFMAETDKDILRAVLIDHEFVPAVSACACHWVAEFGGNSSAWEKWAEHVAEVYRGGNKKP